MDTITQTITESDMPTILDACRQAVRAAKLRGADEDDAVQESAMKCWRNRAKFDPAKAKLSTWSYCIAARKTMDLIEAKANQPGQLVEWDELSGERCTRTRGQLASSAWLDLVFASPREYLPVESARLLTLLIQRAPHAVIAEQMGMLSAAHIWPAINALLDDVVSAARREGVEMDSAVRLKGTLIAFFKDHPDAVEYPETLEIASVVSEN